MQTYTFMCLKKSGVAAQIDIAELSEGARLDYARRLLEEHASAIAIEVWTDAALLDLVERPGAGDVARGLTS